jgi:hypothetical protein
MNRGDEGREEERRRDMSNPHERGEAMSEIEDGRAGKAVFENTVLVLLPEGEFLEVIRGAAKTCGLHLREAKGHADLVTIPAFLAIIDPALLPEEQWVALCADSGEMADYDSDIRFLLAKPSPHEEELAAQSVEAWPGVPNGKQLILVMNRLKPKGEGS